MSKVTVRILICALIASITTGIAPTHAAAALPQDLPDVGVQFHAMWSDYTDAQRLEVVDKMADAGLKWLRIDFGWSSIQPQNGTSYAQWYFDRADRVINAARARGMKVLLTFWRTPEWANGGLGPYAPPTDPAAFGRAARYTAEYFKGRVDAYEVWNEPNLKGGGFWTGTIADYAELLKASYDDFHAGDPDAQVVAGSVVYNDDAWLKAMYDAGAAGHFDVVSTHPYQGIADEAPEAPDNGTKWRLSHVPAVHRLMQDHGDGHKPIWFTEFGWSNHSNHSGLGNWEQGVTSEQQADYMVRAIKYVAANFPYVKKMFWYNERNQDAGKIQLDNYGLLNRDLSPKPVYDRVKSYLTQAVPAPLPEPEPSVDPGAVPVATDPVPGDVDPTPDEVESTPTDEPTAEPTPVPDPAEEPALQADDNLLPNGGFENGRRGWGSRGVKLGMARVSHEGRRAARVAPKRRAARIATTTSRLPEATRSVQVTGFVKSWKARRLVKIEVREVVRGRTIAERSVRFRTTGKTWRSIPRLRVQTTGLSDARIQVRIRPASERRGTILVDSFQVSPAA